jgi:hypothetical protein
MKKSKENVCEGVELKCPECRTPLKPFRKRQEGDKDLICGGCGEMFTCDELKSVAPDSKTGQE